MEDDWYTEEPSTIHWKRMDIPRIQFDPEKKVQPNERDKYLYQILQMLPDQVLHRFWYCQSAAPISFDKANFLSFFSTRTLSPLIHEHLQSYQTAIQYLHMNLYGEPGEPGQLPHLFKGLQSLDLYIDKPTHLDILLRNIVFVGQSLRQLALHAPDRRGEVSQKVQIAASRGDFTRCTSNLKQLKLVGMDITNLFQPLTHFVNFHILTHLGIWGSGGVENFLSDLGTSARKHGLLLEHIAADEFIQPGDEENEFDRGVEEVLTSCRYIKSLHVAFQDRICLPQAIMNRILTTGQDLRILSLHCTGHDWTLGYDEFDRVCRACPNLQQLACQVDEIALLCVPNNRIYEIFMVSQIKAMQSSISLPAWV